MESLTKNRQTPATLRAMIERAYGPDEVPGPATDWCTELGHGWFNVAYRIRLRSGALVVLKIAPPPGVEVMTYERGAMATELAALELIRAHTTVPVPAVDFADRSRELCDADWFAMPFIDGDNLGMLRDTLTAAERDAYQEQLGAATAELNTIRGTAFGPLTGPGSDSWRTVFTAMIGSVLDDGERRGVGLGHSYAGLRALIESRADSLDEVTEPRFVEWDLWDNNAMVRDGRIVAIIDHERAFWGDPLIEAGFTASELPAFGDSKAFMRGYGHAPLTPVEQIRRRLYGLYLALIMVIETEYRVMTDPGHLAWVRARLDEAVALVTAT
ncbi:aminoglycoside phosphotransferase [Actinoplanes italicus]|uniref:Aminoglycoside phosphotransferase (APT) family kinase protein n=1 Tax=Actinoplanes italicus TaxID=113567 RepID=A0A2T0JWQ8_9ACTN|nr:phosphotransferase [Actinoplanes italicus]PRX12170.1 aminoglycoside phosphotransferase (APT) family kinase protein [Actinoplanes italicus]GIE35806.1 aminoglycoside phosphotransferase [Actinoplanes italicus]